MELEQPNHPAAQKAAMDLYGRIDIPFSYYYGISSSAVEYEGILILMVLLCCTLICSPVFSLEYQTGSDSILRCTKRGRKELAIYKFLASLIISTLLYFICMTIWIGLSYLFWGKEGMGTSIQMLFSSISLFKGNAGDMLVMLAGCGILMIISSVCLTLFVSSVTQNTMVSLALSFLLCFMPIIMGWFMPENISNVAKALFPSGGIGLNNGILYDLIDFRFLNIGNLAIWTPFLIVSVALIEIPVWFYMGVKKYKGHVMK